MLPFLGHATIVKTLRVLVIPFVILFAVLLGFAIPHATTHGVAHAADWQTYMEGLAFTITLAGPRLGRVRQRLHPLLPPGRVEEGHRRLGVRSAPRCPRS